VLSTDPLSHPSEILSREQGRRHARKKKIGGGQRNEFQRAQTCHRQRLEGGTARRVSLNTLGKAKLF